MLPPPCSWWHGVCRKSQIAVTDSKVIQNNKPLHVQKFQRVLFYQNIVYLQCCFNFCWIAKWFIYAYIYTLFHILFHYGILQDIEYRSLCYTIGPCFICFTYSGLYLLVPNSQFIPPPFPFDNCKFVCYVCKSVSIL